MSVFLCLFSNKEYECKEFNNFVDASKYYRQNKILHNMNSQIIESCLFCPEFIKITDIAKTLEKSTTSYIKGVYIVDKFSH